ncbi:hypothetical protein H0A36_08305 [Endozoicomonas sp. SM1973]|uniref:Transcriptional regulator HTH-type FeoC domain-containing protein n=1 Tax=Spartinivicinus marinus TaxID=2994442 RepID=A0A853I7E7_9GAMM|nr:hypothetical protein [Spartinivicinus marinus]
MRDYIKEQQSVSLERLAKHFNTPAHVIESMLKHWERKSVITKHNPKLCNKSCSGCDVQTSTIYCYSM